MIFTIHPGYADSIADTVHLATMIHSIMTHFIMVTTRFSMIRGTALD